MQTLAAWDAYERLGSPEGELCIAQAIVYLGTAPKSNALYMATKQSAKAARGSMIYTSGTTGRPKGVRRQPSSPERQAAMAQEVARYWGLLADPSIVVLMNGPMYHSAPARLFSISGSAA